MHACFVKEFTTANFFKEGSDLFGNEDKDDETSVDDEEGSISVTVSDKKARKVSFAGNERVTRGIKNITPVASVAKTVFTNLSKTEEDTRIKRVLKWKADVESEERIAKEYEKELEAQMKEIDVIPPEEDKEDETAVSESRWKELWSDWGKFRAEVAKDSEKYQWTNFQLLSGPYQKHPLRTCWSSR